MASQTLRRKLKILARIVAAIMVLLVAGVLFDLYYPHTSRMREFDPDEVARLETAMWRSYYEQQHLKLFNQLSELLRTQYHMPPLRSNQVAYHAANAAFIFKSGSTRADYEQALPELKTFYGEIRKVSDIPFDVDRVSQEELAWWIIHRQRAQHKPGDLDRALAELQAELYRVPVEKLMEHGRLRAAAMALRDTKAEQGGVTEADWAEIGELLRQSWRSLAQAVTS